MEMRAIDDIGIGQDVTPPLPPLAAVLHHSALASHCSACFSTLPFPAFTPTSPLNPRHVPTLLYCSPRCSSLHSSSTSAAEHHLLSLFHQSPPSMWHDSSDLRLALRLCHIFRNNTEILYRNNGVLERIAGLMTNRERLLYMRENSKEDRFRDCDEDRENDDDLERIREGAKMIAKAREMSGDFDLKLGFELGEMVLCLVLTNAVEVQDKSGCSLGIAVYGTPFSWINHSCSPNACYRFLIGPGCDEQSSLKINAADGNGLMLEDDSHYKYLERNGYGPKVVVRSIKGVKKGEEVTIAYTDLLQPKEIRRAELWLKYQFQCSCMRCGSVPTTYVDYALQALCSDNANSPEDKMEKLTQSFDDAVTDYLSSNDPKSCCKKLENLLVHGDLITNALNPNKTKPHKNPKLHPFNHLSLNAYTTLASTYKVQASDLLASNHNTERHKLEAFNLFKTSIAYSLLLAGAAHNLFMFESSLVASVANFWINAGESLLSFAKDSVMWAHMEFSSVLDYKCNYCGLGYGFEVNPDGNMELDDIKSRFLNCIGNITSKIWSILASGNGFLELIQNPIDFSWLVSRESHMASGFVVKDVDDRVKVNLVLLSVHCLRYGAILWSLCYGSS